MEADRRTAAPARRDALRIATWVRKAGLRARDRERGVVPGSSRDAFPCLGTVADVAALRSLTVAGAAPALSSRTHRLPVSTRPAAAGKVTLRAGIV